MPIKRGVSLYSYQQSQSLKELMLDDPIREVGSLPGVDGMAPYPSRWTSAWTCCNSAIM